MPRTHEDRPRHDFVDHRPGGQPITFELGQWCAIDVAHVTAERIGAGISTYETLVEKARTSSVNAHAAVILRSVNDRRVVALVALDGHEGFRHLTFAWDDHHLNAARNAVAESSSLRLYRLSAHAGITTIDPATDDAYAFEHVAHELDDVRGLITPIVASSGFRGVMIFGTDDARGSAILYRFDHSQRIEAFRASAAAFALLGPAGATGEALYPVHPVKTFA